jgi:hypothetical protein
LYQRFNAAFTKDRRQRARSSTDLATCAVTARERFKLVIPCILLLGAFGGIAVPQLLPVEGARVAVIAPGQDALNLVAAAGGKAISATDTATIAVSDESGFAGRLYRSGAWFVLRYDGLLGCLKPILEDSDNERG